MKTHILFFRASHFLLRGTCQTEGKGERGEGRGGKGEGEGGGGGGFAASGNISKCSLLASEIFQSTFCARKMANAIRKLSHPHNASLYAG